MPEPDPASGSSVAVATTTGSWASSPPSTTTPAITAMPATMASGTAHAPAGVRAGSPRAARRARPDPVPDAGRRRLERLERVVGVDARPATEGPQLGELVVAGGSGAGPGQTSRAPPSRSARSRSSARRMWLLTVPMGRPVRSAISTWVRSP